MSASKSAVSNSPFVPDGPIDRSDWSFDELMGWAYLADLLRETRLFATYPDGERARRLAAGRYLVGLRAKGYRIVRAIETECV